MNRKCNNCGQSFEIAKDDLAFLEKVSPTFNGKKELIPPPTLCPDCREQRRLAFQNALNLYHRTCDLSGTTIISSIRPDAPYKVYRQEDWHSDKWDPLQYGITFDFNRGFFEQLGELWRSIPHQNVLRAFWYDENSDYTNYAGKNKNCYMIFDSDENQDCYFSYSLNGCKNCADCFRVRRSELCVECIDCVNCYAGAYLQDCDNCHDSAFLKNCIGCRNCLMCSNLRNKEYFVENKPVSREQFEAIRSMLNTHSALEGAQKRFEELKLAHPQKYIHGIRNENVSGDYLVECKNAHRCFDSESLWDCRYVYQGFMPLKDCMDVQQCGEAELAYESGLTGYGSLGCLFCHECIDAVSNLLYCYACYHSSHCFGCSGLRRKSYCIFNKQYGKEEYETLVAKIIAHMRNEGSYGEYFPVELSCFPYNESLAQEHYPLTEKEIKKNGWWWAEPIATEQQYMGSATAVPDDIRQADADICSRILSCEGTGKPYRIIPQELALRKQVGIALPRTSFFQRHKERMALRNPRKLWDRNCAKCKKAIATSYAPERPEIVYCEECYLSTVY